MKRFLEIIFTGFLISFSVMLSAYADDFVAEDEFNSTESTSYTLDSGGSATDSISLQFGGTLNETIGWNIVNTRFDISDDVRISGSLELGTLITFDASNVGSGNDIRIIANQGSDNDGEIRYNATSNQWEFSNDGGAFTALGSGNNETSSTVIVDPNRTQQTGIVYNNLAGAISYINTQSPGANNRFIIEVAPGTNAESVTIPTYTILRGVHSNLSTFTGIITLGANAIAENIKTSSGGELYVAGGNTAYVHNSDVVLGDGSGGIDGTLSITRSFVDGQTDATGIALIYESLIGVSSFTNAGTLGTYNSSVFNLTDSGTWTNYGTAYDNAVLASGLRLTSTTTQGAIDELVQGSPSNQITLNKDETGDPDQDVEIIAEQGTENNGIIRYDDGNNRWEISNNGAAFNPIATATGDEEYFDAFNTAVTNVTSGFTDIPLNTERKKTSAFTHSASSAEVTINNTATYIVTYTVTTDITSGIARSQSEARLMHDDGGGYSIVAGSNGRMYNRLDAQGESTATRTLVMDLDAGDKLKIQASRISGIDTVQTLNGGSSLTIVRTAGLGAQGPQGIQGPSGSNGAGWVENGAQTETSLNVDISGTAQVDGDINSRCGPHGIFWAERGTVSSNASWAMGNGQTPYGSPAGCSGRVRKFAATCTGAIGTSLGAEVRINNVSTACSVNVPTSVGSVAASDCDVAFTSTDVLGVYAQTEVGSWTECVGTFWVRYD